MPLTTTFSIAAPEMVKIGTKLPVLNDLTNAAGKIGVTKSRNTDLSADAGPFFMLAHG